MSGRNSKVVRVEKDKFVLRLNDGVRDRITALAKETGRSMNAYINVVLNDHLERGLVQGGESWVPSLGMLVKDAITGAYLGEIVGFYSEVVDDLTGEEVIFADCRKYSTKRGGPTTSHRIGSLKPYTVG